MSRAFVLALAALVALGGLAAPAEAGPADRRPRAPGLRQGAPGLPGPGRRPNVQRGRAMLNSGMSRAATDSFRQALQHDPTNGEAHVGLGLALARNGKCNEGLPHLLEWTDALAFGPRAALVSAACLERMGEAQAAVEMDLYALERRPTLASALTRLALDADRAGDPVLRDVSVEYLWYVKAERDESLFAEAALALRRGDLELLDALALLWEREGRDVEELDRLRARAALDLDDPTGAIAIFQAHPRLRRGTGARLLNLEAGRREGLWAQSLAGIDGKQFGRLSGGEADAIRARLWVDAGELAKAAEILAEYPDEQDEEQVASRWYLARAQGDVAAMAELAATYEHLRSSPLRQLEQLIPINRR